jgi:hypothetical protein
LVRRHPSFIGIGVVRGGTTWLWANLRQHPEIWLSPVKEIEYFNRIHPIAPQRTAGGELRGEKRPHLLLERLKAIRPGRLGHYLRGLSPGSVAWKIRFYGGTPSPEWYGKLFTPAGDRVSGDITPHYCALGPEAIGEIARDFPDVKLILMLRDPIARDWSHAVHFLTRYGRRPLAEVTARELLAHFRNPSTRLRGDYAPMLERWERYFPPQRLRVFFFDDIRDRPVQLYGEVCRYLGVSDDESLLPRHLSRKVNPTGNAAPPAEIERHLAALHLPALEQLAARYGTPVDRWRERAAAALAPG